MIWYKVFDIIQMDLASSSSLNDREGIILKVIDGKVPMFKVWLSSGGIYFPLKNDIKHASWQARKMFLWDVQHHPKPEKKVVRTLKAIHKKIQKDKSREAIEKHAKTPDFVRFERDLTSAADEYNRRTIELYNWRWMGKTSNFWYSFDRALTFAEKIFNNEEWTRVLKKYLDNIEEAEFAVRIAAEM